VLTVDQIALAVELPVLGTTFVLSQRTCKNVWQMKPLTGSYEKFICELTLEFEEKQQ